VHLPSEAFNFGVDESLKVTCLLADCFYRSKQFDLAIDRYETIKKKVEREVVFDKPIFLINTCT
jgi:coenzyme F420-reducing hydrogenase delta subunit